MDILARHAIRATFFFSVGPDNMGRHLWRLLRPAFLLKMLRSRAASLYGWDILLMGTFWPGPDIGRRAGDAIRAAADAGHEVGLHAWDHHGWQGNIGQMDEGDINDHISRGLGALKGIVGRRVDCAAAPAWKVSDAALLDRESRGFRYLSDCRGHCVFRPVIGDRVLGVPQVPATLPTYDEIVGRDGIHDGNYNDHLLGLFRPEGLNVLTIHAEAEGGAKSCMFEEFLGKAAERGITFTTLGECLESAERIPSCPMLRCAMPGRDGWVSCQAHKEACS